MLDLLKNALDTTNPVSFGRTLCVPTIVVACFVLLFLAVKNHAAPDASIIIALGGFSIAPYGVSKVGETVQSFSK